MSKENADRLKDISTRLENYMNKIKSGEVEVTEDHFDTVDELENVVSDYENILNKEKS